MLILCLCFAFCAGALNRASVLAQANAFAAQKTPAQTGGNYTQNVLDRLTRIIESMPVNSPNRARAETARTNLHNHAQASPQAFEKSAKAALRRQSDEDDNNQSERGAESVPGADKKLEFLKQPGGKAQLHQMMMQKMAAMHHEQKRAHSRK